MGAGMCLVRVVVRRSMSACVVSVGVTRVVFLVVMVLRLSCVRVVL